jgi:4'-phosphopantetheinyl transferase
MIDWLVVERSTLAPAGCILAPPEQERYAALRTEKRRADWLLGRWAAKCLVRQRLTRRGLELPPQAIMILSDPDGAPRVVPWGLALTLPQIGIELESLQISISHTEGRALCALRANLQSPISIGADIERIAPRGAAFAEAYDTEQELELLGAVPAESYDALSTAIWSAKEATLKLTRHGLRVDTRAVTCLPALATPGGWAPVGIRTTLTGAQLAGWWQIYDGCVITIVVQHGGEEAWEGVSPPSPGPPPIYEEE